MRQARSLTAHRSTDLAWVAGLGSRRGRAALEDEFGMTGSWCRLLVRKEHRMDGGVRCTEDSVDDCSFSTGGFSIDEPSNRPLQRTVACGARR